MCNRGALSLCDFSIAAMWTCNLNFNIKRIWTFVMELCGRRVPEVLVGLNEHLLLRNSLLMAPWCRNMYELTPDMKYIYDLFYCNVISEFLGFFKNMEYEKIHVMKGTMFKVVLGHVSSVCSHFALSVSSYHWSMLIVYLSQAICKLSRSQHP